MIQYKYDALGSASRRVGIAPLNKKALSIWMIKIIWGNAMENKNFLWVNFYSAFADKLLSFESDRKTLLDKLIKVYGGLGIKFQKLERDDSIIDIDPFTVFGMFNKGITAANKTIIIKALAKEFELDDSIEIPTVFDGIPVLNNLKAVFFGWDRTDTDIDNLWKLFRTALNYADAGMAEKSGSGKPFVDAYNNVIKQGCIKWNITMGLFWIRPYTYLNLDSRSRWFLKEYCSDLVNGNVKALRDVPDGELYLSLCHLAVENLVKYEYDYKNLPELSHAAYVESERINQENRKLTEDDSAMIEEDAKAVHYWLYAAGHGSEKWEDFYREGIMAIGWGAIGDLTKFEDKNQIKEAMKQVYKQPDRSFRNDALATWQFAKEMKVGDVIIVKRGTSQIIGRGVVDSDYIYNTNKYGSYNHIRKVKWTHKGEWRHPWHQIVTKTLTDITQYIEYVEKLNTLFVSEEGGELDEKEIIYPPYSSEDFLNDVYMSEEDYTTLVELLEEKKNVILQGAPGVGKTYAARRLAYSMMGVQDPERVMMIQFHQTYSYEDFIMGYRPTENGKFVLKKGPFYNFCKKAEDDSDNDYFFIIDEINRGNLSKIFGELLMLVEKDKRSKVKLQLLYSDEKFSVPENLYLIGMMNTADRSLAMLDYAMRRRFAFYDMKPGFDTDRFIWYKTKLNNSKFDKLIHAVELLNRTIASDDSLGEGFQIGHSYFCNLKAVNDKRLSNIVEYELIPMLKEYWFDEPAKVKDWSNVLRSAIQ